MKSLLRGQRSDNGENQTATILSAGDATDDDHHHHDHDGTDDDHDHDGDDHDLLSRNVMLCLMMMELVLCV